MVRKNIPAFIPDETQISSMEAFREAVLGYEQFQTYFMDKLDKIDGYTDEDWHEAFAEYHELLLENPIVAVTLSTTHGLVDDLQFIPITDNTAWKMGLD